MSAIFISYSRADREISQQLADHLKADGHRSLFLDVDDENGIQPGDLWEQELYRNLRQCEVVIVLCSNASMTSTWVFTEVSFARALKKPIIPLQLEECEILRALDERNILAFDAARREAALRQLDRKLREAKVGWRGHYRPDRGPYPGFDPFDCDDAAVFFGRDTEIVDLLNALWWLRQGEGPRMIFVLGGSGSGKSSLVRAGLVPNLEMEGESWLVVPPFRPKPGPRADPMRQLAGALAERMCPAEAEREAREAEILAELDGSLDASQVLRRLAGELRAAAGRKDTTVLLVIDQLDELLTKATASEADRFLAVVHGAVDREDASLMVLCTLRADYYEPLRTRFPTDLVREIHVEPLPRERWHKIIEGPAERAGLALGPGLVSTLINDTESENAVPLLAFTLRQLWMRYGRDDGELTLDEYRNELGGLAGSVAHAAAEVMATRTLSTDQERELRRAFTSQLVTVDERGQYVRQAARFADLDAGIHDILLELVKQRLLVVRESVAGREVEVAHDTLFRSWAQLDRWLDEGNRTFLVWRRRVQRARADWEHLGRDPASLLRGRSLEEARGWLDARGGDIGEDERVFLEASIRAAEAEERAAATQKRTRRRMLAGLYTLAVALLLASGWLVWQREQRARELWQSALLARAEVEPDTLTAALLLTEMIGTREPLGGTALARRIADRAAEYVPLTLYRPDGSGEVIAASFSPYGMQVAAAAGDSLRLWWPETVRPPVWLPGRGAPPHRAAFSRDGSRIVAAAENGTLTVWETEPRRGPVLERTLPQAAAAVALSADGSRVASGGTDGSIRVWRIGAPADSFVLPGAGEGAVGSLAFSPDGDRLAIGYRETPGHVALWGLAEGTRPVRIGTHAGAVWSVAFDSAGARVLTTSQDGTARIWELVAPHPSPAPDASRGRFTLGANTWSAAFDPRGTRLIAGAMDGTVRGWDVAGSEEVLAFRGHRSPVVGVEFSTDGTRVLTRSADGAMRVWRTAARGDPLLLGGNRGQLWGVAFSPDGGRVLTGSEDGVARIWMSDSGAPVDSARFPGPVLAVSFSRDGLRAVIVSRQRATRVVSVCPASLVECREVFRHEGDVWAAAQTADASRVTVVRDDGEVWLAASGGAPERIGAHEEWLESVAFTRDGARVLTVSSDGAAIVWRTDARRAAARVRIAEEVGRAAISEDGDWIAGATEDGRVRLWSTGGGDGPARVLGEHQGEVYSLEFSPDQRFVLSAAADGTARLWPVSGAGKPVVLDAHSVVQHAAFSPDGSLVVTASDDGLARVWRVGWRALLEHLRTSTSACLSASERVRLLNEPEARAQQSHRECQQRHARPSAS